MKPSPLRYCSILLGASLAAFTLGSPTNVKADADTTPVQPSQAQADDRSKAAVADLGVTEAELLARVAGQDSFTEAVHRIKTTWPSSFVDANWGGTGSTLTTIKVHANVVQAARQLAGKDLAPFVVASSAMSNEARAALESQLVAKAVAVTGGTAAVSADVDPFTLKGSVTVEASPPDSRRSASTQSLVASLKTAAPALKTITVDYTAPSSRAEYGSGGNWGSNCTAGFTATRGSGQG